MMSLKSVSVTCDPFGLDWSSVTGRLWFVDERYGERIGYFLPVAERDDRDCDQPIRVSFEQRAAFGGLDEVTEFWSADRQSLLGFFVPETDTDRARQARFETDVSAEELDGARGSYPSGKSTMELLRSLQSVR